MKYIFVAGAPGSKWSSVVKNIYYSPSLDQTDYSDERTYYHDASGNMDLMHIGAYFDPGMEFDLPENLTKLTKEECEALFDRPFSGKGTRIIKSHIFSYKDNINFLRRMFPDCPIILVHRSDDSCLGWWVKCGHFNITYPIYDAYYKDLPTMAKIIKEQNKGILECWWGYKGKNVTNNRDLARALKIEQPPEGHEQDYVYSDVRVMVI